MKRTKQGKTGKINVSLEMRQLDLKEKQLGNTGKLSRLSFDPSQFSYRKFMTFISAKKKKNDNDQLSLMIDGSICHDQLKIAN